ncbi:cAMP-activated global transcriptional regulator CRP [Chryseobacterium aquaeductus]|uniref:cAMP-activated global transcriptional regulator CRP n=1 Tax=Chryseobacterium aquaeductus TaxID=2675056 RepID=A0A9N8MIU6_9FLAO|nr:Crp/Fnr family transcriptional regulator [Chryseobacterium aquaeductus]CAA7332175.1 cAMP-activated global transcriptional regulator CRP [Chryseobacterium potabilaquae]CAD7814980.1 cAMP-activated global transcriptional regulator CRP [Chryseobacterium aquaeductus]
MINEDLLFSYSAEYKNFKTNDVIFEAGDKPLFYYQITSGKVKINNFNDNGKEFIQGIVGTDENLILTALFTGRPYPLSAQAIEDCQLIRLPKQNFLNLLKQNPEHYVTMVNYISENMYYKYIMLQSLSFQNPENKLKTLMNYLKDQHQDQSPYSFQIPYTRQQLASITGLSVETVIRVIKIMEKNEILKIQNRKIFF